LAWAVNYSETARRQLRKLDKAAARRILDFLDRRIAKQDNARSLGKALSGPLGTFWRYRIGDYRAICEIRDESVTVLVLRIGHRREVYR
jgi:mRNA interferase RelE/StbE